MSRKAPAPASKTAAFNPKTYVKNGLSEDEVMEVKEAFDLFDIEGCGSIDPKCTSSII